jgi:hypothetical protein
VKTKAIVAAAVAPRAGAQQIARAQPPSTDAGARAKTFAVRGFTAWKLAQSCEIKALRHRLHGRDASSDRWYRKCLQVGKRSGRYLHQADVAFKEAGYKPPPASS